MLGQELHLLVLRRRVERGGRLVREHAQRLQPGVGGDQAVGRVVDPDHAHQPASAAPQRHEQPVVAPRRRPAAVVARLVRVMLGADAPHHLFVLDQMAALDLELGLQQPLELGQRHGHGDGVVGHLPARWRRVTGTRRSRGRAGRRTRSRTRAPCGSRRTPTAGWRRSKRSRSGATTPRAAAPARRGGGRRRPPPGRSGPRSPHGRPSPPGSRAPRSVGVRPDAGSSTERMPIRWPSEWRSGTNRASSGCQLPGVVAGIAGGHVRARGVRLPVDLAVRDQVGAVMQEALLQERLPHRALAGVAHQALARLRAAVHGRDGEVVPRGPVEVDGDGREAERARDRPGDGREQIIQLVLTPDKPRHLEKASQAR